MPIAFGNSTRVASFSNVNTMSGNGPSVSGTNVLAVVHVGVNAGGGTPPSITSVTWGGVTMTEALGAAKAGTSGSFFGVQTFYLVAPAAGVSTVAVNCNVNWNSCFASCDYFTGVDTSNPINGQASAANSIGTTESSTAVSSYGAAFVTDNTQQLGGSQTLTATSPSVRTQNGNSAVQSWGAGYQGPRPAGSTTMAWGGGNGSFSWIWGAIVIQPATWFGAMDDPNIQPDCGFDIVSV